MGRPPLCIRGNIHVLWLGPGRIHLDSVGLGLPDAHGIVECAGHAAIDPAPTPTGVSFRIDFRIDQFVSDGRNYILGPSVRVGESTGGPSLARSPGLQVRRTRLNRYVARRGMTHLPTDHARLFSRPNRAGVRHSLRVAGFGKPLVRALLLRTSARRTFPVCSSMRRTLPPSAFDRPSGSLRPATSKFSGRFRIGLGIGVRLSVDFGGNRLSIVLSHYSLLCLLRSRTGSGFVRAECSAQHSPGQLICTDLKEGVVVRSFVVALLLGGDFVRFTGLI